MFITGTSGVPVGDVDLATFPGNNDERLAQRDFSDKHVDIADGFGVTDPGSGLVPGQSEQAHDVDQRPYRTENCAEIITVLC